jgi:hypothetical protein
MFDEIGYTDIGCTYIDNYYFLLVYFSFYEYAVSFILFDQCKFEVYFVWDKYCYFCLFSRAIDLVNLPDFHPKPVFVSVNEVGLL